MDPIPWWVESYVHPIIPYLDGGSPNRLSPPCDVVFSAQPGAGMVSDWIEVTDVPLVVRTKWLEGGE
jgi:hypothetical protein